MSESLRLRSLLVASVSAAAMLGVAAPAFAQDTTVGEVVVTAQKKEEAIQDVPIAVSAFSADSLEKAKIDGGPNLVLAVPNVSFSKGNFTGYNFQIRGIGAKLVSGSGDAGTGIHLNNAPLTANNLFEAEFFDVERVEVLRGPQGTLYGRNATGGVVNLITAQPTDEFDASIRLEAGNFGSKKVRGMVNIPLGDTLALRVAGAVLKRDGYGLNIETGSDVDDRDLWNTRATLAWTPTDTFRATLLWDHFKEDDARSRIGKGLCVKDPGPATGIGATNFSTDNGGLNAIIQRGTLTQGCKPVAASDPNILGTVNTQGTLAGVFGAFYGLQTGDASAGQMQDQNVRHIQSYLDPVYQAETDIVQFNISWDLTDSLQLTSLTGYSENSLYTQQDYARIIPTGTFNAPGPMGPNPVNALAALGPTYTALYAALFPGGVINDPQVGARNRISTIDVSSGEGQNFSQELRLQSNFAGPVNFNIGAIYLDFVGDGHYTVFGNTLTAAIQIENNLPNPPVAALLPCAVATPCYIDPNAQPNFQGHNYFDNTGEYHLKSRALFGEVYWQVTDSFKLTGGLRYTHDMKRQEVRPNQLFSSGPPGVPLLASQPYLTADFKEMTGRLGFDWKPDLSFTDESLIYLFYSRGYKAGGMNPQCSSTSGLICPPPTFEPEFVNAWELGMKNTLMGGAMVLNLTGFKYDYIGYQVSKIVNRSATNENIDAEIKGLELETVWSPFDGFRINMAVGYLATEITSGKSVDVFDPTGGNPLLTLVKASSGANCVVSTAQAEQVLGLTNHPVFGPLVGGPFGMYGICSTSTPGATVYHAAGTGPLLIAGGPRAATTNFGFGALIPGGILVSDGVETDLAGKELPNTPHYTFSLGAQYAWTVGGGWDATVRADYYRQTDSFARMYNTAADVLEGWENVNATITLGNYEAGWSVEIYGKNLMDETVLTDTYLGDASAGMVRNGFYGEPRTYGMAVTKTF